MKQIQIGKYTRITKSQARKLLKQGKKIYMIPCKVNPCNMWFHPNEISLETIELYETFDNLINHFTFYNCNYEMGYYPAFYIKN